MKIETVTYLKKHANNLRLNENLIITKNGKPSLVVQSYADYQEQQETVALLKLLMLSEKSLLQGEALSLEQAFS